MHISRKVNNSIEIRIYLKLHQNLVKHSIIFCCTNSSEKKNPLKMALPMNNNNCVEERILFLMTATLNLAFSMESLIEEQIIRSPSIFL